MDLKSKIILIYGPTASGKSNFAIKLSKKINGEIINADSMQVYKELKILSARPSIKNYQKIKHHLFGFQSVKNKFSTGDWLKLAKQKILDIKKRKKVPILVGGTGLYFKSLTDGLVSIPNIPVKFREKVRSLFKKIGSEKFFLKLNKIDPLTINKIRPTDTQRVIRAYEVKSFTKKSIFDWFSETRPDFKKKDFYKLVIDFPREELFNRINLRVIDMIKAGAILEVKSFLKLKVAKSKTASKAIGINEIKEYLKKKIELEELIKKISIRTRHYAKRQMTWSRGNMIGWKHINSKNMKNFLDKVN